jgi:hypothetical protein
MLRRIFGLKGAKVTRWWTKLHYGELLNLCSLTVISGAQAKIRIRDVPNMKHATATFGPDVLLLFSAQVSSRTAR